MTETNLHELNGVLSAVSLEMTSSVSRGSTLEQPADAHSQPAGGRPNTVDQQPVEPLAEVHIPNNASVSRDADLEEGQSRVGSGEPADDDAAPPNSDCTRTSMVLLIVGILFLIVVPGFVLGLVTGQVQWGIALSGAVATMVGVFAGIFYHRHRG